MIDALLAQKATRRVDGAIAASRCRVATILRTMDDYPRNSCGRKIDLQRT